MLALRFLSFLLLLAAARLVETLEDSTNAPSDRLAAATKTADVQTVEALLAEAASGWMMSSSATPVDVTRRDHLKRTALMLCGMDPPRSHQTHAETDDACGVIANHLIKAGADVAAADAKGWTPIAYAAAMGWSSVVRALVVALGSGSPSIDKPDFKGVRPLSKAALHGRQGAVAALLEGGADAASHGEGGWTALHYASGNVGDERRDGPWLKVMQTLLRSNGGIVDGRADGGRTPLMVAAGAGSSSAVRLLLDSGADPSLVDDNGQSALAAAGSEGVRALLREAAVEHAMAAHGRYLESLGKDL